MLADARPMITVTCASSSRTIFIIIYWRTGSHLSTLILLNGFKYSFQCLVNVCYNEHSVHKLISIGSPNHPKLTKSQVKEEKAG